MPRPTFHKLRHSNAGRLGASCLGKHHPGIDSILPCLSYQPSQCSDVTKKGPGVSLNEISRFDVYRAGWHAGASHRTSGVVSGPSGFWQP